MLLVIFLIGGLVAMGAVVATLATSQHFSVAFSARSAQAYLAARAGVEYAAARITAGAGCAGVNASLSLEGYDVAVTCNASAAFDEGAAGTYNVFDVTATASGGSFNAPDVVNRRVRATVKFP